MLRQQFLQWTPWVLPRKPSRYEHRTATRHPRQDLQGPDEVLRKASTRQCRSVVGSEPGGCGVDAEVWRYVLFGANLSYPDPRFES